MARALQVRQPCQLDDVAAAANDRHRHRHRQQEQHLDGKSLRRLFGKQPMELEMEESKHEAAKRCQRLHHHHHHHHRSEDSNGLAEREQWGHACVPHSVGQRAQLAASDSGRMSSLIKRSVLSVSVSVSAMSGMWGTSARRQAPLSIPTSMVASLMAICCRMASAYNRHSVFKAILASALQLKRKLQRNKLLLLHAGSNFDIESRKLLYLLLLLLIYCCVLMRATTTATATATAAATATATTTPTATPRRGATRRLNTPSMLWNVSAKAMPELPARSLSSTSPSPSPASASASATNQSKAVAMAMAMALTMPNTLPTRMQRLLKRDAANVPDKKDDDSSYRDDEFDEYDALINNKSAKGKYIGAPCNDGQCDATLVHVVCAKETLTCGCEKNFPVQLGLTKGCDKPKKLGEQCFYDETCIYNDENSLCVQVRHNAMCQCASGFHLVSYTKPTRRVFCTQDLDELSSDLPTLLGVTTGIAVLAGLICMVLHLFSKTKYPRHRNFGDANLPPPIMYSSDTGIPLTVQSGRPSSRSSLRSTGSIGSYGNRRASSGGALVGGGGGGGGGGGNNNVMGHGGGAGGTGTGTGTGSGSGGGGSKGILVSTSRTGSRRPSLASVHSTSSSIRSYSMMRFEKEAQQKEIRQEMKLRLARLQQQQQLNQNKPQIVIGDVGAQHSALSRISMATPSPITPNSTDELLPAVHETQEPELATSTSKAAAAAAAAAAIKDLSSDTPTTDPTVQSSTAAPIMASDIASAAAYIGPCSSSTEAL